MSRTWHIIRADPGHAVNLVIMLLRGTFYFLVRLQKPRLVFMDRGARIYGLRNIRFTGRAKIGAHALVDARHCIKLSLGRNFSLGDFSILRCSGSPMFTCPGVSIGHDVSFGPYCNIGGGYGLSIGDYTIVGPYVSIHPEYHVTANLDVPIRQQGIDGRGIVLGQNNWFGAKATVLDGVTLGDDAIVAAAALVTRGEYGSRVIYAGVPAREIGKRA
ncbi:acyltransferase [Sphingomonadaceae bacterium jetA1]|jgi:acetyltransferase-like isoleucine patch superfamily enzyme|uniref:acyltransferase n=1 Tax=Facivitalis istanbulensis TaxID=3075838 RepID=UPI00348B4D44